MDNSFKLLIGNNYLDDSPIYLSEYGLYQNFLITGTIGTGKTSSAIYPFVKQFIEYNSKNINDKIGMLILDVKGNFYSYVSSVVKNYNMENDLFVIVSDGVGEHFLSILETYKEDLEEMNIHEMASFLYQKAFSKKDLDDMTIIVVKVICRD